MPVIVGRDLASQGTGVAPFSVEEYTGRAVADIERG